MSYPRLYAANAAVNKDGFENLGLGMLSDAISCTVTEERNGEFELEMEYPVDGIHFSDITEDKLLMSASSESGSQQIFRIYKKEDPIDGVSTIYAEHISYLLSNVPVLPFGEADSNGNYPITSATKAFEAIISNLLWKKDNKNFPTFPFSFEASTVDKEGTMVLETPSTVRSVLGGTDGSVLDTYGGEYEFDNFTVKLHKQRGNDTDVYLRYGKNITDLKSTGDISSVYTGILPYWKGSLQRKNGDTTESYETIVYLDDKMLWSDYTENYAYPLANVVDMSSYIESDYANTEDSEGNVTHYTTEAEIRSKLKTEAESYLKNNTGWEPSDNIEVSFINLWDTPEYENFAALQKVRLCDTVHVIYQPLDIDVTMKVITTKYNVLLDRYDSIELGEPKSSFTSSVANSTTNTESKIEQLETSTTSKIKQAQQEAADMINGKMNNLLGVGKGVIQFDTDAAGNITQIVATDKADRSENLMVLNLNGLGFSRDGGNSYGSAVLLNGNIVADQVKVGILSDGDGTIGTDGTPNANYWLNLETGEVYMKDGTFAGTLRVSKGEIGGYTITSDCLKRNKSGLGRWKGNGIYIGSDGIAIGQADEWNGQSLFEGYVANDSSTFSNAKCTGLGITGPNYNSLYNGSYGYLSYWEANDKDHRGLKVNVHFRVEGDLRVTQNIYADNFSDSDRRLKNDIADLNAESAVNFVLGLKPVSFKYIKEPDRLVHGFIAQDVRDISYDDWSPVVTMPHQESEGTDYLSMSYTGLIADMVATIQYQNKRIDDLEARITKLEEELKK